MSNTIAYVDNQTLTNIADAIRDKTGTSEKMLLSDIPDKIRNIEGIVPTGTQTITENGEYDVLNDKSVMIDVQPDLRPLSVSENGSYVPDGFDGYSSVTADIELNLTSLAVTENGLYLPESGTDGFDRVNVDVPQPSDSTTITQNGTYNVEQFASAVVDVPDQYLVKEWTEESEKLVFCNYWSDKIADRDESAYIYVMKFYGNTHSNGVQLLLYGAREDTKVIAIRANTYRLIDGVNYYDPNIYDLFASAGTIVKVYRIPKTTS